MGVGPFQGGTIREQTKLAGSEIALGKRSATGSPAQFFDRPPVDYNAEIRFDQGWPVLEHGGLSPDMLGPDRDAIPPQGPRLPPDPVEIAKEQADSVIADSNAENSQQKR